MPTLEIIRGLKKEGFVPDGAKQSASRSLDKAHSTTHLIRLRDVEDGNIYNVGDNLCEILLKNANDGTSPCELMAGLNRIRCMNSLVTQTGTIDAIRVRHSHDATQKSHRGQLSGARRGGADPPGTAAMFTALAHCARLSTMRAKGRIRSNRSNCCSPTQQRPGYPAQQGPQGVG
ncbi:MULTISPECIES: DUF932 domain-containing protein [Brucella]|uniref:DUF932 domain-containing protein n=1 Tax=Brucella TaxID=234 RepID=UPI002AC8924A|nr:DUF932 domain-containing protein [Brucella pseudogrignonensis]